MTVALVLGSADTLWGDIERLKNVMGRPWDGPVVACNDAGAYWPGPLSEWCSYHPVNFMGGKKWCAIRQANGYPGGYRTWTAAGFEEGPVDMVLGSDKVPRDGSSGTSGLLAALLAIELYGRGVLCGIPMDRRPHFAGAQPDGPFHTDNRERDNRRLTKFLDCWEKNAHILKPNLRSMSGRTMQMLGLPDARFLQMWKP